LRHRSLPLITLSLAVGLTACRKKEANAPAPPPPEVSVVTVASERVNRTIQLPGRINAMREAQVRARATGILLKRLFEEGSNVQEGQILSRSIRFHWRPVSTVQKRRWQKRRLR